MNTQLNLGSQLVLICALLGVAFIIFKICNIIVMELAMDSRVLDSYWHKRNTIGNRTPLLYLNKSEPPRF